MTKITQKNLRKAFPKMSQKDALTIVRLVNGTLDAVDFQAGYRRVSECYHQPSDTDVILHVINSIAGGYGVEGSPYEVDAMYDGEFISYVNMGDPYYTTILFNPRTNRFELSNWGSVYETSPAFQQNIKMEGQ